MKIRKGKYLLFAFLCLFSFNVKEVFAANAKVGVTSNAGSDGVYGIGIIYEGQTLDGYCAEQGKHLSGLWEVTENNYTCSVDDSSNGAKVGYILSAPGYSKVARVEALRFIISGTPVSSQEAQQLVNATNGMGNLVLTKTSENENVVTYTISEMKINPQELKFTCGKNCSSVTYDGNKTVKVTVTTGSCDYEFFANYPGGSNGALRCVPTNSPGDQITYAEYDSGAEVVSPTPDNGSQTKGGQSFKGSLENTGSSYYKKYCDDGDTKKCNQKTEITIPEYCDDESDQKITVVAPTDVKNCILKGKDDANNTYQMTNQGKMVSNNPYCSVYCKEDYEMTLPGARFAESGRYFKLTDTLIHGTRSCYATSSEGAEKSNIEIEKFIQNIIKLQQDLIKAKDAYEKAIAEKNVAITVGHDEKCTGETTWQEKKETDYTGYDVDKCDPQTGVCTYKTSTKKTNYYKWGDGNSKSETIVNNVKQCTDTPTTYNDKWEDETEDKKNAMADIVNKMRLELDYMEQCYSWTNNFCMNTEVKFNYNEQYNTMINYTKISGGGEIIGTDATYKASPGEPVEIDNEYTATDGDATQDYNYLYCDDSGCNLTSDSTKAKKISTKKEGLYYRKIVVENSATYNNKQEFKTKIPHGTIEQLSDGELANLKHNYYYLGAVFPVALKTPYGVYKWTLDITKLGQYNDYAGCKNGRLDDVAKVVLGGNSISAGIQYVCVYVVDCPDCDYECVGEYCEIPDCDDGECAVECVGNYCVYNGNGDTFTYRTVSLNDLNKAERTLGVNLSDKKGTTTVNKIIDTGEKAYENYEATFLMTAENMKSIRDYNKITGNYVSQDLTFEKNNDYINGKSEFLRSESINTSSGRFSWRDFFKSKDIKDVHAYWTDASADLSSVTSPNTHVGPAWK